MLFGCLYFLLIEALSLGISFYSCFTQCPNLFGASGLYYSSRYMHTHTYCMHIHTYTAWYNSTGAVLGLGRV